MNDVSNKVVTASKEASAQYTVSNLESAAKSLRDFYGGKSLTLRITELQRNLQGSISDGIAGLLTSESVDESILDSAFQLKTVAGQINVVIHAVGILLSLPFILDAGEVVSYVSLGAGNTGRAFDLETDKRVAEFKFINWQGGAEAIRQNQLFKDFFYLAEYEGDKRRYMYVLDTQFPLKFLNGRRAINSVLSRNRTLRDDFHAKHGEKYRIVCEYFQDKRNQVDLINLSDLVPCFRANAGIEVAYGEDSYE